MIILLFVVHMLIALALIGVVMLQKSEGGALGMGGGGDVRLYDRALDRQPADPHDRVPGAAFFVTSILLVLLSQTTRGAALDHRPGRSDADADAAAPAAADPARDAGRAERAARRRAPASPGSGDSRAVAEPQRPIGAMIGAAALDRLQVASALI